MQMKVTWLAGGGAACGSSSSLFGPRAPPLPAAFSAASLHSSFVSPGLSARSTRWRGSRAPGAEGVDLPSPRVEELSAPGLLLGLGATPLGP